MERKDFETVGSADYPPLPKEPRLIDDAVFRMAIEEGKEPLLKAIIEPILGHEIEIKGWKTQPQIKNVESGYQPILDCIVELKPSGVIDLEAQREKKTNIGKRIALYHSTLHHMRAERGTSNYLFESAIGIWICEFDLFGKGKGLYRIKRYSKEADFEELEGDDPIYVFNCEAKEFETETLRQLAHDMICEKPKEIRGKILGDALSLIRDKKMEEVRKKHMETYDLGYERGHVDGFDQARREIALRLSSEGSSAESIAKILGIPEEEVLAILNKPSSNA